MALRTVDLTVSRSDMFLVRSSFLTNGLIVFGQARSQKSAIWGCYGGLKAESPTTQENWGSEGKDLELKNFVFFGKNNLILCRF